MIWKRHSAKLKKWYLNFSELSINFIVAFVRFVKSIKSNNYHELGNYRYKWHQSKR